MDDESYSVRAVPAIGGEKKTFQTFQTFQTLITGLAVLGYGPGFTKTKVLRCKIKRLPLPMRMEIDRQLREGSSLIDIAQWLISQVAAEDIPSLDFRAGHPYSLLWTRDSKCQWPADVACQQALSRWFSGGGYSNWLREQRLKAAPRYASAGNWTHVRPAAEERVDRRKDRWKRCARQTTVRS
jgi:hypothetical protein